MKFWREDESKDRDEDENEDANRNDNETRTNSENKNEMKSIEGGIYHMSCNTKHFSSPSFILSRLCSEQEQANSSSTVHIRRR